MPKVKSDFEVSDALIYENSEQHFACWLQKSARVYDDAIIRIAILTLYLSDGYRLLSVAETG